MNQKQIVPENIKHKLADLPDTLDCYLIKDAAGARAEIASRSSVYERSSGLRVR